MFAFPTIPAWTELHPLVIHFPVALLLVAPLFVVVGALLRPERGRPWLYAALVLMVLGTIGAYVAVATGEAVGEAAERNAAIKPVIEQHEELAETTRTVFTVLTIAYAVLLFPVTHTRTRAIATVLPLLFLVFYAAGALLLANTAHQGGRLVHELGSSTPAVASTVPVQVDDD